MLQKYVSSWSLAARKLTFGGSEARVVQPAYGSDKAATTWSGAETRLMFGQPANAVESIVSIAGAPAGGVKTITVARAVHPSNAFDPMVTAKAGMMMLANELHSQKVLSLMAVTESGMAMLANDLQEWKALSSRVVTESGMVTLANELHP